VTSVNVLSAAWCGDHGRSGGCPAGTGFRRRAASSCPTRQLARPAKPARPLPPARAGRRPGYPADPCPDDDRPATHSATSSRGPR